MLTERQRFIDIAKGLSMICIVLGHLGIASIDHIVYTFHVPIFFVITGYFISTKYQIKDFIVKKFKTLVIPYVVTCIVVVLLSVLINEIILGGVASKDIALQWIKAGLYGTGASYVETLGTRIEGIGAIWFLLATFFASIILRLLLELKPVLRMTLVGILFAGGYFSSRYVTLPFSIQPAAVAVFYMYIGYLIRQHKHTIQGISQELKVMGLAIAGFFWIDTIRNYSCFLLVLCIMGNGIKDIFGSLCGCLVVLFLSKLIEKIHVVNDIFSYLGKYSSMLLCLHIIELNLFPWYLLKNHMIGLGYSETLGLALVILGKFLWIILGTILLSKCKFTRKVFGFHSL